MSDEPGLFYVASCTRQNITTAGDSMNCQRCENLMFPDWFAGLGGGHPSQDVEAWRCFACGDIVDHLIRENHNRRIEEQRLSAARRPSTRQCDRPAPLGPSKHVRERSFRPGIWTGHADRPTAGR